MHFIRTLGIIPRRVSRMNIVGVSHAASRGVAMVEHRRAHGTWPRINAPQTFSEKLARKMLLDRRQFIPQTADKLAVRDYVSTQVGPGFLPELYTVSDDSGNLTLDECPESFVVKASHGSGWVKLVGQRDEADLAAIQLAATAWLDSAYSELGRSWWYAEIPRRILVEEYLGSPKIGAPPDYKFFVMNRRVQLIQVDRGRFEDHRRDLFTPSWQSLDVSLHHARSENPPSRPPNLDLMLELAVQLSRDTDFVRVDLYDLGNRVVFGELTHAPGGGLEVFHPPQFDRELGATWDQPRYY